MRASMRSLGDCALCDRIRNATQDTAYYLKLSDTHIFESPFAKQWPGALMLVYERHREEVSDIVANGVPPIYNALLTVETAMRNALNPVRMNVVKFGNVCAHLHWHLIPRYAGELYPEKTSWELQQKVMEELYTPFCLQGLESVSATEKRARIFAQLSAMSQNQARFYYAAAMIFRPKDKAARKEFFGCSVFDVVQALRAAPNEWQTLLMKRNYDDFVWDHFGGCANESEFPRETLLRELHEESGWMARECAEVSRHWNGRILRGFTFFVMPENEDVYCMDTQVASSDEVAEVAWVDVSTIMNGNAHPGILRARITCLLDNFSDFDFDDSANVIA